MMGWIKNGPKKYRADFSSVNTFPPKPTSFLLDLSVLGSMSNWELRGKWATALTTQNTNPIRFFI